MGTRILPLDPEVKCDEDLPPVATENNWSLLVQPFNSTDTQVLEQLRQSLLKCAAGICSDVGYDLTIKPTLLRTLQFVQRKRKERVVFVTKQQFPESNSYLTEQALSYLLKKDYVREFRFVPDDESSRVICVDSLAFSNLVVRSHLDAGGHVFRLEAGKFWPSNMDRTPPNPEVLARVLEQLQSSGMVPESFLPLLWNTPYIRQDHMYLTMGVMECLGLICHANTYGQALDPSPVLDMPFFNYLSGVRIRHVMLMNKLTEVKPVLHWTDNPHKGDFQITVHFCCPSGMPVGVVLRVLALCLNVTKPFTQYSHIWQQGVLIQLGHEVKIHVHAFTNELDFTARVVSDSYSDLKMATQVLWMTVAPCLGSLLELLSSFPGLAIETYLSFRGDPNFDEVFRRSSTDRRLTIDQLVSKQLLLHTESVSSKWLIPFKVDSSVTSFETWLAFLMANRKDVLQILAPDLLFPPDPNSLPVNVSTDNMPRKTTRKTSKVSWNIENKTNQTNNNNNSVARKQEALKETALCKADTPIITSVKLASETKSAHVSPTSNQTASSHQGVHPGFDEQIALKVASSLSAAVLSSSVARFMEEENTVRRTWSPAQVLAVREISRLSSSVWEGDMTKISSAISNAVANNQRSSDVKVSNGHSPAIHSTRFCVVL
ncbi:uncharacterized protein LOC110448853 [Mizuhopecten yessoensis]|uniref:uncharacterized protein LOC110448853 n=1 Tax=Mizuhopecten yessoensis TaxID=6573 RepID=UPI000B45A4BF|nr:uncharacterized protein LOC110448853 [Mizuhopecten yessoensis]